MPANILKGDVSFITGAASGFGKKLADALVEQEGRVILADIDEATITKLAAEYNAKAGSIVAIAAKVDTTIFEEQAAAFEAGQKAFGRIDYVFANAGIAESSFLPLWDPSTAADRPIVKPNFKTIDIDLYGQLNTAALGLQYFERQEKGANGFRGKLIVTASILGYYPCRTMPMYAAAKAAMVNYMRSASMYYANKDITVNSIAPNLVDTGIAPSALFKPFHERGILTPIDLVITQFLAPLGTSTMNGQALSINQNNTWVHDMSTQGYKECEDSVLLLSIEFGKLAGINE